MSDLKIQLESYAQFVRAGHAPVSVESVMAAPPVPEHPGRGGRRRYVALVGAAVVVLVLAGAVALATRHHDSGLPVRTGPATTSAGSFCDDMRQAWGSDPFKTTDHDTVPQFATKMVAGYRAQLPSLERAEKVAPPDVARALDVNLVLARQIIRLDPHRSRDRAQLMHYLTTGETPAQRAASTRLVTYANEQCHLSPPQIYMPGGVAVPASEAPTTTN